MSAEKRQSSDRDTIVNTTLGNLNYPPRHKLMGAQAMAMNTREENTYPAFLLRDPSQATERQIELMKAISEAERRGSKQEKEAYIWLLRASVWGRTRDLSNNENAAPNDDPAPQTHSRFLRDFA